MIPATVIQRIGSLAISAALALLTVGIAAADPVRPVVLVSGPSPYAACTIGGSATATVYTNAEVEPFVAANPANSQNIVAVWQQDRWSDGGARGLVAGFSFDGGKTWGETTLPFSACAGGLAYERASDPWVSFGPDGTAYVASLEVSENSFDSGVAAATSHDGGKTWGNIRLLIADNQQSFQVLDDKESVTADPTKPGVAYVVWTRFETPTANPEAQGHAAFPNAGRAPALLSITRNGGLTWSPPKAVVDSPAHQGAFGNVIVVDPRNGTLYDIFDLGGPPWNITPFKVAFVKSTDGGSTWTTPRVITDLLTVGVSDPKTGQHIRTSDNDPEAAIDPATGQLYVVWQDARFNGGQFDEVAMSTSTDGGATWSAPTRVNTPTGSPAFTPGVSVNAAGVVAVTYYDFRGLTSQTSTLPTDYWFTKSTNHGASFTGEAHLAGPFDMLTAPDAGGFFVGDYEGLGASGTTFLPFFVEANSGNTSNRTDVFSTTVAP